MRFMPRVLAFVFGIIGVFSGASGLWQVAAPCGFAVVYFGVEAICEAIEGMAKK